MPILARFLSALTGGAVCAPWRGQRALFGDFDIDEIMDNSRGYLNALLFIAYLFVAIFIMLSMFLAILAEAQVFVRDKEKVRHIASRARASTHTERERAEGCIDRYRSHAKSALSPSDRVRCDVVWFADALRERRARVRCAC